MPDADRHAAWRAAREGAALFARPDDGPVEVTGPERAAFLNTLVTNKVDDLAPGSGTRAMLLHPTKGRVLADFLVLADEPATWLECRAGSAPVALEILRKYHLGRDVDFHDRADAWRIVALAGPAAGAVLEAAGAELPADAPGSHVATAIGPAAARVVRWADTGLPGFRAWLAAGQADPALEALRGAGAFPGDPATWTLLQIEGGIAAAGRELTDRTIPLEAPTEDAIHHGKGCYPGQEVIARLWARGRPAKSLRGLAFDDGPPAPPGTGLDAAEKAGVATVTASATSPERGPIALAYVHRDYLEPGTRLTWEGGRATVAELPFARASAGAPG